MFPLGTKPIVLHVVEEAVASGITDIIFVVSHSKHAVENFFTSNEELEKYYLHQGKLDQVGELRRIMNLANYSFVFTKEPFGNGGALLSAKHLLNDEPFAVLWADEVLLTESKPRLLQCIEAYSTIQKPIISGVEITDPKKRCRYGMAELKDVEGHEDIKEIVHIVEKPAPGKEPSIYATHGAYILPPEIFDAFETTFLGKNGELWLTDLINTMSTKTGLYTKLIESPCYLDCGNPLDYLYAQITYGLHYGSESEAIRDFIQENL